MEGSVKDLEAPLLQGGSGVLDGLGGAGGHRGGIQVGKAAGPVGIAAAPVLGDRLPLQQAGEGVGVIGLPVDLDCGQAASGATSAMFWWQPTTKTPLAWAASAVAAVLVL